MVRLIYSKVNKAKYFSSIENVSVSSGRNPIEWNAGTDEKWTHEQINERVSTHDLPFPFIFFFSSIRFIFTPHSDQSILRYNEQTFVLIKKKFFFSWICLIPLDDPEVFFSLFSLCWWLNKSKKKKNRLSTFFLTISVIRIYWSDLLSHLN